MDAAGGLCSPERKADPSNPEQQEWTRGSSQARWCGGGGRASGLHMETAVRQTKEGDDGQQTEEHKEQRKTEERERLTADGEIDGGAAAMEERDDNRRWKVHRVHVRLCAYTSYRLDRRE